MERRRGVKEGGEGGGGVLGLEDRIVIRNYWISWLEVRGLD